MKVSIYFELFVLDAEAPTRLCKLVLLGAVTKITTTLEKYRVLMIGSISKGLLEEVIFEVILYTLAWFFEDSRLYRERWR